MKVLGSSQRWAYLGTVATILAGSSFTGIAASTLVPAMPAIAQHFNAGGQGTFFAQLVLVAPSLSVVLGSPLSGAIGRRVGQRTLMLGALLVYVLAGIFPLLKPDFAPLIVSRLLLGLASSFLSALSIARAVDFPPEQRNKFIGFTSAVASVASIASIIIAGWLAGKYGWQASCLVYAWPLPLLLAFFVMPARTSDTMQTHVKEGFAPYLAIIPILLLTFLWSVILFSIPIEGPFLLATRGMDNPALIGFVMGAMGLVAAVSAATYGWVSRRLDYAQQILLVFVLFLASSAMIALTNNVPFTGAGIVFAGISGGLLSPLLIAMLIRRVDARHITTAIGLFASTMFTSQLLDPFLFKAITAALPINPFIATMAICTVGVSVSLLLSTRNALFHRSKAV